MKRVLVKSVFDAFDYVMDHYYPAGLEDLASRSDTYAVISIQDTHTKGFGLEFRENQFCKGVLTLYFDDIVKEVPGAVLFSRGQAEKILDFIHAQKKGGYAADSLLCGPVPFPGLWGLLRLKMLGGDNSRYFKTGTPNPHVINILEEVWDSRNCEEN